MSKEKIYERAAAQLLQLIGGKDNVISAAHCATRLRIVLKDDKKVNIKEIEEVDLVKGSFNICKKSKRIAKVLKGSCRCICTNITSTCCSRVINGS